VAPKVSGDAGAVPPAVLALTKSAH
jgi:hypothetical protein